MQGGLVNDDVSGYNIYDDDDDHADNDDDDDDDDANCLGDEEAACSSAGWPSPLSPSGNYTVATSNIRF